MKSWFGDPLFRTYAIAAAIMIVKMAAQAWITVARMMKVKGGYRSPEDVKRSVLNPEPSPEQLERNEYVERSRRMHQNDCENVPLFLVVGLLFIATAPPLWVAQVVLYGYVGTRLLHFLAYMTAQLHDVRAALWTPGSFAIIGMAGYVLVIALAGCSDGGGRPHADVDAPGEVDCTADPASCEYLGKQLPVMETPLGTITDPQTGRVLPLLARYPMGPGPYPIVIWSHGGPLADSSHLNHVEWSRAIASDGYIVIHLSHVTVNPDTAAALCALASVPMSECVNGIDPANDEAPFATIARPRDVIALLDELPALAARAKGAGGPAVDLTRIAIGGWSGGSRAPMVLFGAKRHLTPSVPLFAMPDPRPRSAFAVSPGGVGFFGFYSDSTGTSWDGMRGPMLVATGDNDLKPQNPGLTGPIRRTAFENEPSDGTRQLLYSTLPAGVGDHDTFNLDDMQSTDQRLVQLSRSLRSSVLAYLDATMLDDANAKSWLASDRARTLAGNADWTHQ